MLMMWRRVGIASRLRAALQWWMRDESLKGYCYIIYQDRLVSREPCIMRCGAKGDTWPALAFPPFRKLRQQPPWLAPIPSSSSSWSEQGPWPLYADCLETPHILLLYITNLEKSLHSFILFFIWCLHTIMFKLQYYKNHMLYIEMLTAAYLISCSIWCFNGWLQFKN